MKARVENIGFNQAELSDEREKEVFAMPGLHATNSFYYYRSYLTATMAPILWPSRAHSSYRLQPNILLWSYQTLQLTNKKLQLKKQTKNISLLS